MARVLGALLFVGIVVESVRTVHLLQPASTAAEVGPAAVWVPVQGDGSDGTRYGRALSHRRWEIETNFKLEF